MERCSSGLDLYLWLTWRQLYRQFGTDPAKARDQPTVPFFRRQALRELKKIKLTWPELNYSTAPGVLIRHLAVIAASRMSQPKPSKGGKRGPTASAHPEHSLGRLRRRNALLGFSASRNLREVSTGGGDSGEFSNTNTKTHHHYK